MNLANRSPNDFRAIGGVGITQLFQHVKFKWRQSHPNRFHVASNSTNDQGHGLNLLTEAELQKRVLKYARNNGIFARKLVAVNYRGFPDILLAYGGYILFLELKTPNGTGVLSKLQKATLAEMQKAGLQIAVADTYDDAIRVIGSALHVIPKPINDRATGGS